MKSQRGHFFKSLLESFYFPIPLTSVLLILFNFLKNVELNYHLFFSSSEHLKKLFCNYNLFHCLLLSKVCLFIKVTLVFFFWSVSFNGTSISNSLFNAEFWYICKCLVLILKIFAKFYSIFIVLFLFVYNHLFAYSWIILSIPIKYQ